MSETLFVFITDDAYEIETGKPVATMAEAATVIRTALQAADPHPVRALCGFQASIETENGTRLYEGETRDIAHLSLVNPSSWVLDLRGGHYEDTMQITADATPTQEPRP